MNKSVPVKTSIKEEESVKSVKFVKMLLQSNFVGPELMSCCQVNVLFPEINWKMSSSPDPVRVLSTQLLLCLVLSETRSKYPSKGSLQKKPQKKFGIFQTFWTPPPKVWKVPKILGFFKSPKNT